MARDEDLAAAARAVIRKVGVGALTLARVAQEAGISRATIYRRFSSRQHLIDALVADELDALERVVLERLRFSDDPHETVVMLVREVLHHLAGNDALQSALKIDGALLLPWLIRRGDGVTLVDIVTARALGYVEDSPLETTLRPDSKTAVEFMVSAVYADMLSPAKYVSHAQLATYIADAIVGHRSTD
ncbi:helix-turn-helix domain-containing protein [Gordonia sp. ABSL1-1]|uniref:TetR/AcrR family transcriptional regulator n=1 Tax=Gordonia sp. ABSL1-1 TaxID=3053923 RepID=UPI0025736387|nr:TetR/AcrR family transcriptional regulator [Gordonia sp. ABSL1-1]MDL9935205.1 helix-turn-helix domain-containing protein [Gordonia sp. ABSL1-1]